MISRSSGSTFDRRSRASTTVTRTTRQTTTTTADIASSNDPETTVGDRSLRNRQSHFGTRQGHRPDARLQERWKPLGQVGSTDTLDRAKREKRAAGNQDYSAWSAGRENQGKNQGSAGEAAGEAQTNEFGKLRDNPLKSTRSEEASWASNLRSLLSRVRSSNVIAILCHQNADPDATCSAFALQTLVKTLSPATSTKIVCPEGVSSSTKQLLENLGIATPDGILPAGMDAAILVDTNTPDQLGKIGEKILQGEIPIIVIDHHHPHPDTTKIASLMIVDESAAAAAEVVYQLIRASKTDLGMVEARALLAAIFVETKHFLLARESTFKVAAGLVKAGADPRRLSEILSTPMSRSERVARLKAAGRSQIVLMGNWIVATSDLGSYQSSAARALLSLGAHVAFVAGESKDRVRVNMRATEDFHNKTGVHLARDLSIPIGKKLGGVGGGHPTAAGLSVPGQVQDILKICVDVLRESAGPFQT